MQTRKFKKLVPLEGVAGSNPALSIGLGFQRLVVYTSEEEVVPNVIRAYIR